MYDFRDILLENEKILWEGIPSPKKNDKKTNESLIVLVGAIFLQFITIGLPIINGRPIYNIFIILFLSIIMLLIIYNIIYEVLLKRKKFQCVYYCITNKRAIVYNGNKDKLTFGYIFNYNNLIIDNVNDDYGNLLMSNFSKDDIINSKSVIELIISVIEIMLYKFKEHPGNAYSIQFESIQNPNQVANIIREARMKLEND